MRSFQHLENVGTSSAQVVPLMHNREVVIFSGDGTNTFTISQLNPVVAGQGIIIGPTLTTLELSWSDLGDNIRQPFYAICSAVGGKLTVIEGFT